MPLFPLRVLAFQLRSQEVEASERLKTARLGHEQNLRAAESARVAFHRAIEEGRQLLADHAFSSRRLQWEQATSWTEDRAREVEGADLAAEKSRQTMEEAIRAMRSVRQRHEVVEHRRLLWLKSLQQEIENKLYRELDELAGGRPHG